jgi:hypothetical protein
VSRTEAEQKAMSVKSLIVIMSLAAVSLAGTTSFAVAQTPAPAGTRAPWSTPSRAPPPRIEVNPRPRLYRRCVDWYVLQYRPSGTVLFPEQHCWWVRG